MSIQPITITLIITSADSNLGWGAAMNHTCKNGSWVNNEGST